MKNSTDIRQDYLKREETRKLKSFAEYRSAGFAGSFTAGITLILAAASFDFATASFKTSTLLIAAIFLVETLMQFGTRALIAKDILNGEIKNSTRRIGFVLMLTLLTGNIFMAIASFDLIKKEKSIEYTLATYSILTGIAVIFVSALNLFKEYVADHFMMGMGILVTITVFYIFTTVMVCFQVKGKKVGKVMKPIGIILVLSVATGNIFALMLGLVLLAKLHHKEENVSIEWVEVLRRVFRNNMAVLGMFVVVLLMAISLCSMLTFDYSIAIDNNYSALLQTP